jgi:hypothetical protein
MGKGSPDTEEKRSFINFGMQKNQECFEIEGLSKT